MPKNDLATKRSRAALRYTLFLVGVQIVVLCFTCWALTHRWFFTHADAHMLGVMSYGAEARGLDCEVVAFGDSTALADFSPSVIEKRTGLKTCNVSELKTVVDSLGVNDALDLYLAHNKPPRFLVTGWTPASLNLGHERDLSKYYEPTAFAVRYDRGPWLWKTMLGHGERTARFLVWAESSLASGAVHRVKAAFHLEPYKDDSDGERALRMKQKGMWATKDAPQQSCTSETVDQPWTHAEAEAGIAAFRKRYESPATQVLVLVTPVADCKPNSRVRQDMAKGLTDNELQALPVNNFNLGDTHLAAPAAERFSDEVADLLLARMHKSETEKGPATSR